MKALIDQIVQFRDERNWKQFHSGENLAKSLSIEANEVLELFQWSRECNDLEALGDELADVMTYALFLCENYHLDPKEIILKKLEKNRVKYPVEKAYGKSDKYTKL